MNRVLVAVFGVSLALSSCGSDGGGNDSDAKQSELVDLLVDQAEGVGFDEQCIRDKAEDLSEDDAQFLIDNFDSSDTESFSSELQTWIDGLIDCLDDSDMTETSDAAADEITTDATDNTDAVSDSDGAASDELVSIGKSGFSTWTISNGETWASAAALVINDSDQDLFVTEVTFNFVGADGTPVATESTYVTLIPAGESFPAAGRHVDEPDRRDADHRRDRAPLRGTGVVLRDRLDRARVGTDHHHVGRVLLQRVGHGDEPGRRLLQVQ